MLNDRKYYDDDKVKKKKTFKLNWTFTGLEQLA